MHPSIPPEDMSKDVNILVDITRLFQQVTDTGYLGGTQYSLTEFQKEEFVKNIITYMLVLDHGIEIPLPAEDAVIHQVVMDLDEIEEIISRLKLITETDSLDFLVCNIEDFELEDISDLSINIIGTDHATVHFNLNKDSEEE